MAAFNFSESAILAAIYGKALQSKGYTVTFRNNLGSREVVEPALVNGEVDAYATYAATELTFLKGGWPRSDAKQTVAGLTAADAFKETQRPRRIPRDRRQRLRRHQGDRRQVPPDQALRPGRRRRPDEAGGAGRVRHAAVLRAGAEEHLRHQFQGAICCRSPSTAPRFKTALKNGNVDVAELGFTDGTVTPGRLRLILQDDKHLQLADNMTPIIRTKSAQRPISRRCSTRCRSGHDHRRPGRPRQAGRRRQGRPANGGPQLAHLLLGSPRSSCSAETGLSRRRPGPDRTAMVTKCRSQEMPGTGPSGDRVPASTSASSGTGGRLPARMAVMAS